MRTQPLVELEHVDRAVRAHLDLVLGAGRVGWRKRPDPVPAPKFPYWVARRVEGGGYTGPPLTGGASDVAVVYQLDAVGGDDEQATWAQSRGRSALIGIAPAGAPGFPLRDVVDEADNVVARVIRSRPDGSPSSPTAEGTVWSVPDRYVLVVTPT